MSELEELAKYVAQAAKEAGDVGALITQTKLEMAAALLRQPPAPAQVTEGIIAEIIEQCCYVGEKVSGVSSRKITTVGPLICGIDDAAIRIKAALQTGVPGDGTLTCLFCAKPLSDNAVQDDNGDSACADCATAEKAAQHKEAMIAALKSYRQADEDGVMVLVSRQAVDEAVAILQAGVPSGSTRNITDEELIAWAERHDLKSLASKHRMTDLRALFDDAKTLHLLPATPAPGEGR